MDWGGGGREGTQGSLSDVDPRPQALEAEAREGAVERELLRGQLRDLRAEFTEAQQQWHAAWEVRDALSPCLPPPIGGRKTGGCVPGPPRSGALGGLGFDSSFLRVFLFKKKTLCTISARFQHAHGVGLLVCYCIPGSRRESPQLESHRNRSEFVL